MRAPIFQVDAFTAARFAGNPAAVVVFERFPDDALLQAIAMENNLSETAFLEPAGAEWSLRWFTPRVEVPLCGLGTLASAWVVLERLQPSRSEVTFLTRKIGPLRVRRRSPGYAMDFPSKSPRALDAPPALAAMLGASPREVLANDGNYVAVMESADVIRALSPDMAAVARLDRPGLVVTAAGDGEHDCVSRYFAPAKGVPEDPVTGGAHCALTPYWAARLGKSQLRALQASPRGGVLQCRLEGDRVELAGECAPYLEGHIEV